jgi:hypothetical protein
MSESCVICLGKTGHRICTICRCNAHKRCWNQYTQQISVNSTYLTSNYIVLHRQKIFKCPQCRSPIQNIRPLTRSITKSARANHASRIIKPILINLLNCKNRDVKHLLLDTISRYIYRLRTSMAPEILHKYRDHLKTFYKSGWSSANIHHYNLYGTQIDSDTTV